MNYLQVYIQDVSQVYQTQNAIEHSYLPALKKLIESLDAGIQRILSFINAKLVSW